MPRPVYPVLGARALLTSTHEASRGLQKAAPCGVDSTNTYQLTNVVTRFAPGQTITLQWTETVAHTGWFRIAISYDDRADLVDPTYTVVSGLSTDASVEDPVEPPVLVDHLYPHTLASVTVPKSYTYDLTLPATPCAKCTLQVIQVMLDHPLNAQGGFTYHHCADIEIADGCSASGGAAPGDGRARALGLGLLAGGLFAVFGRRRARGTKPRA